MKVGDAGEGPGHGWHAAERLVIRFLLPLLSDPLHLLPQARSQAHAPIRVFRMPLCM